MLTVEENELLARVGPGTPGGELLRRYWQPVGMLPELSDATPTKHVRILGEDLVLFRTPSSGLPRGEEGKGPRVGLLGDHCPHRGASLLYGRVEERGIACAYHGWLYDTEGNCLETPAEPADSLLHLTVKHRAYPVQERYGLYWAYLGPLPAPVLPRYDVAEVGPVKSVKLSPRHDCNWLQVVENNLDQSHVFILHQSTYLLERTARQGAASGSSTTRGLIDELANFEYHEAALGIDRTMVHQSGYVETDLMMFPGTARIFNFFDVKVPIDDTHTRRYLVYSDLGLDGASERDERDASNGTICYYLESLAEGKSPQDAIHPFARYRMDTLRFQDLTVTETQGPVSARENEHLASSDKGVVLLRTILKREIEKVQQGLDPIGVIRDPDDDLVDTHVRTYIDMVRRGFRHAINGDPGGVRLFADPELAGLQ